MNNNKIIYYYQNFTSLNTLISQSFQNVYVYVASLHFDKDPDGQPYLTLNNTSPDSQIELWLDLEKASINGINILVMLGGAGGAYGEFFNDYTYNYQLLYNFLKEYPLIKGIDLDVEEQTSISDIKKLINQLSSDFGDKFIISMAPIESAMSSNIPGFGGFSYKDLFQSWEGQRINWFNVQCYQFFTESVYTSIIQNGYPPEKITFGMLGDNFTPDSFPEATKELEATYQNYPTMNGVCLWEYGDTTIDPIQWGTTINNIFQEKFELEPDYSCSQM